MPPVGGRRPATEHRVKTEKPAEADRMLQRCRRQLRVAGQRKQWCFGVGGRVFLSYIEEQRI